MQMVEKLSSAGPYAVLPTMSDLLQQGVCALKEYTTVSVINPDKVLFHLKSIDIFLICRYSLKASRVIWSCEMY